MRHLILLVLLLILSNMNLRGQSESSHLRKGNELYEDKKFNDAEIQYRKGLEKNKKSWTGQYNLANSLYKQEKYAEAASILDSLRETTSDKNRQSKVYHNLGNALLKDKQYEKSVEAYKQALKLDPKAEDSRYNLSYAYQMLKKQQQQQQQQQQNKQEKKDPQKQKQEEKKQDQKKEEQKQNIDREEAERMLDALDRQEKQLRKEQEKKEQRPGQGSSGKDW